MIASKSREPSPIKRSSSLERDREMLCYLHHNYSFHWQGQTQEHNQETHSTMLEEKHAQKAQIQAYMHRSVVDIIQNGGHKIR